MPNKPYGQLVQEVLQEHPIRNQSWMYHPDSDTFSIDASQLSHDPRDPWGRPVSDTSHMEAHRDRENDVTHWTGSTTVAGTHIELTVFNT